MSQGLLLSLFLTSLVSGYHLGVRNRISVERRAEVIFPYFQNIDGEEQSWVVKLELENKYNSCSSPVAPLEFEEVEVFLPQHRESVVLPWRMESRVGKYIL